MTWPERESPYFTAVVGALARQGIPGPSQHSPSTAVGALWVLTSCTQPVGPVHPPTSALGEADVAAGLSSTCCVCSPRYRSCWELRVKRRKGALRVNSFRFGPCKIVWDTEWQQGLKSRVSSCQNFPFLMVFQCFHCLFRAETTQCLQCGYIEPEIFSFLQTWGIALSGKWGTGALWTCPGALKWATSPPQGATFSIWLLKLKGPNFVFFWFCFKEIWFHLEDCHVHIPVPASCCRVDHSTTAWL